MRWTKSHAEMFHTLRPADKYNQVWWYCQERWGIHADGIFRLATKRERASINDSWMVLYDLDCLGRDCLGPEEPVYDYFASYEILAQMGVLNQGFGNAPVKDEGSAISDDQPQAANDNNATPNSAPATSVIPKDQDMTYRHVTTGNSITITRGEGVDKRSAEVVEERQAERPSSIAGDTNDIGRRLKQLEEERRRRLQGM